ncbi:MAG: PEP-CTERM sorting domain-containing protein [Candidatus Solibacter usitatus]|nr:PEP-CTERM sorting domain-containing protein [Candidatus Solibacter usitatus]
MFTAWLQADTIDPNHFVISLNDNQETGQNDTEGTGGWGSGSFFTGTPNPDLDPFTPGSWSCSVDGETVSCGPDSFLLLAEPPDDPRIGTKLGGLSQTIDGTFGFNANAFGGGAFDFQNGTGEPITQLLLHADIDKDTLFAGGSFIAFNCDGGDAFDQCGFIITDPPGSFSIDILFSGGHIAATPAVPEPSTWMLFGTAACALLARKAFRRA